MTCLRDGILGGISGKIGDVIGYIRYGKAYVKMKLKPCLSFIFPLTRYAAGFARNINATTKTRAIYSLILIETTLLIIKEIE